MKKIKKSSQSNKKDAPQDSKLRYPAFSLPFTMIVFSAFVALAAGAIGCLLVLPYFNNSQINSEVNVSDYNWGNSGLIIRDPKKVVVNQDLKIEESINSVSASMFKFYPRLSTSSSSNSVIKKLDSGEYYSLKSPLAVGVTMSADGWVLVLWPGNEKTLDLKKVVNNFDALSAEGKVYHADRAIFATSSAHDQVKADFMPVLIHLSAAGNLPVRNLAKPADLRIGQSIFSYDGGQGFDAGFLAKRTKLSMQRSSEDSYELLTFDFGVSTSSHPVFIFNLAGDLLAWQTPKNESFPVYTLSAKLNSLFKSQKIVQPYFGVNYYNLADVRVPGLNQDSGALLYATGKTEAVIAGSPAEKAGLKKGDLILEINGEAISKENDLSAIIQNYLPGQEILVSYSRSGVNAETSLKLESLQ